MISLLSHIGENASVKGHHSGSSVFDQMIDFVIAALGRQPVGAAANQT